jgi:hypothetical protein
VSLSAADLASVRTALGQTLSDSCDVLRGAMVTDWSGTRETERTVATYPCRIAAETSGVREAVVSGRTQGETQWIVTLPVGADVRDTDRLSIGGVRYEVVAVLGPQTLELSRKVRCRKEGMAGG